MKKLVVVASPFFAFMLLTLVITSACGASDLDRDKAKSILEKKLITLKFVIFEGSGVGDIQFDTIEKLKKHGYISQTRLGEYIPTQKGAPYCPGKKSRGSLVLEYGIITSTEITGIFAKDKNIRIVEGRLVVEPHELGKIAGNKTSLPLVAIFKRYDDGWRFVEIDFEEMGRKDPWCKQLLHGFTGMR